MIDFSPLDHFVQRMRLDAMTRWGARPRRLRWWPLLPIGSCLLGGLMLATQDRHAAALAIVPLGIAPGLSAMVRLWGPVRAAPPNPLDEREQLLRLRSNAIGYGTVAYLAVAAVFWMMAAQAFSLPVPTTLQQWLAVVFTAQTLILMLPVLVASWSLAGPLDEIED